MINCTIAADELATEFSVVRNEFEMGENQPKSILDERMMSTAYLWHNYGKSTIGSRADIERVPVPALKAFYKKYYQPDNAMLVVSGKFETPAALASIEKIFGALEKPTRVIPPPYTVEPVQDGERTVTLRRNGDIHVVGTTYHTAAGASPDYAAMGAALSILTRKPSGRLYKALVTTNLASSVEGNDNAFRDPGVATFLVEVRDPKNLPKVKETLVSVVEGLGNAKLEEAELERWRNAELKEFDLLFADSERVAIQLSEYAALGDWRTMFAYREQVKKVSIADVSRVSKAFFKASNRTLGEFIPTKEIDRAPLTEAPSIASVVDGIQDRPGAEQGEAFTATLDTIEARTVRKSLKGGLEAAFLPKKNRGGKVLVGMALRFGDAETLANKTIVAAMTVALLKRGTTKHGYQELRDAEDKVRSAITFRQQAGVLHVEVDAFREQLPAAIDLVAEMLTGSTFPEKELEVVRSEALARAEQQLSDPQPLAWCEIERATTSWPKYDPRYTLSIQEQIDALKRVTVADIRAFHRDFLGASRGEVVGVGDLDVAALSTKLETAFGTWASKKPYARLADKAFDLPGGTKTVHVKDKEMAQIVFRSNVVLKQDSPDYAPWLLLGQILGGDTGSRIWMRLREKEGLSYGASAWTSAEALDEVGSTNGYAIVAPANADKALASILDELKRASSGVVNPEELTRAKDAWTKSLETNLSNDAAVAQMLGEGLHLKRTLVWTKDLRTKVNAVTREDMARVAKKYLVPEKVVVVKAGTF